MNEENNKKNTFGMPQVFALALFVGGIAIAVHGAKQIIEQHLKNMTYKPVSAVVLHTGTAEKSDVGRRDVTYKPVVKFEYHVKNKRYTSGNLYSIPRFSDIEWARSVAGQFDKGDEVHAFYNPEDPADAYLIKYFAFFPYLITLASLLPFLFGSIAVAIPETYNAPRKVSEGKFEIEARTGIAKERLGFGIGSISYLFIGLPALAHFFYYVKPPYSLPVYIVTAVYGIIAIFYTWSFAGYVRLGRNLNEIRLYTDTDTFFLGDEINIRGCLQTKRELEIKKMLCGLDLEVSGDLFKIKEEKKLGWGGLLKPVCYKNRVIVMEGRRYGARETVDFSCIVKVPEGKHPSTPPEITEGFGYTWNLVVRVRISKSLDYNASYPIYIKERAKTA